MSRTYLEKGFSILELLVASAVSIILLGLFLTVSTNILDAWGESRDKLSTNAKARLVLDTLARDLESSILGYDQGVWLACDLLETTDNSERWETVNPQKPAGAVSMEIDFDNPQLGTSDFRFGVAGSWVRFFGSPVDASTTDNSGDINAISYQLIRRGPHSRSTELDESYNLYRSIVRGDYTLNEVVEDGGYYIDSFDGDSLEGHPGEVITPRNDSSLFVRDVIDLGIVFYRTDATGRNAVIFPKTGGPKQFRVPEDGIPTSANLYVRILDEAGARQLNAYERGLIPTDDDDFWWKTVNQYSTVHTRWVQFKTTEM